MKNNIILVAAIFALAACENAENKVSNPTTESIQIENTLEESVVKEIEESTTVTNAEMAHYEELLELTSTETAVSDCYITESFLYMDQLYITVDFVSYKLDEDSKNTDYEIYDLVNDVKTLRTFVVLEEYNNCGRDKTVTISELLDKNKAEKNLVFSLECEDGIITELYIDTCSG